MFVLPNTALTSKIDYLLSEPSKHSWYLLIYPNLSDSTTSSSPTSQGSQYLSILPSVCMSHGWTNKEQPSSSAACMADSKISIFPLSKFDLCIQKNAMSRVCSGILATSAFASGVIEVKAAYSHSVERIELGSVEVPAVDM